MACDRLLALVATVESSATIVRVYARSIERTYWPDPAWQGNARDYTIDPAIQAFALHEQMAAQDTLLHQQFKELCGKDGTLLTKRQVSKLDDDLGQLRQAKERLARRILQKASAIFTTCDCASNDQLLKGKFFRYLVVDEAAQATEVDLATCCLLATEKITLFGDHLQLGPVLTEQTIFPTFRTMASRSLFERLVGRRGASGRVRQGTIPHVTLCRQYRMHPTISAFPNQEFYDGQLVDAPETLREGFTLPSASGSRLVVIDVQEPHGRITVGADGENHEELDASLCNPAEAEVIRDGFIWLLRQGVRPEDIAVITPYRAQAEILKASLRAVAEELPTIGTAHLLQGEERKYVLLSLVRSYACADVEVFDPMPPQLQSRRLGLGASVGFLKDARLANVALTRAQLGLFVVGNTRVLAAVPLWEHLFQYAHGLDARWSKEAASEIFAAEEPVNPSGGGMWPLRTDASGSESEGGHWDPGSEDDSSGHDAFEDPVQSSSSEQAPAPAPAPSRRGRGARRRARARARATAEEDSFDFRRLQRIDESAQTMLEWSFGTS